MEWLCSNNSEILFSSSVESCSPPSLIIITTDDEGVEDSTSEPDVISISSEEMADMEATMSGIDRIRDRSNEHNFYKALDVACVQYACGEVVGIMDLTDDKECYIPSSGLVLHILRWLAIDVTAKYGNMQWRCDVKNMFRKSLTERYANMHGDTDDYAERCANMYDNTD